VINVNELCCEYLGIDLNGEIKAHFQPLGAENNFDGISLRRHNHRVAWEVEVSDEFIEWYDSLGVDEWETVNTAVDWLAAIGPSLGRPHVDTLHGSSIPKSCASSTRADRIEFCSHLTLAEMHTSFSAVIKPASQIGMRMPFGGPRQSTSGTSRK
jgi:hypothetical protein